MCHVCSRQEWIHWLLNNCASLLSFNLTACHVLVYSDVYLWFSVNVEQYLFFFYIIYIINLIHPETYLLITF